MTESSIPLRARRQAGLTLIEFMVAIVIGMLMVAAMAALIANQSTTRGEVDRSGKLIENGRYAIGEIAKDVEMAGYWGEVGVAPPVPALTTADGLPDPCNVTVAGVSPIDSLQSAMGLAIQGYDAPATLPTALAVCVKNHRPGTDVLVVRKVDPDTSDIASAKSGEVYLQTGLNAAKDLTYVLDLGANTSVFDLTRKGATAPLRKYSVHIYYISRCSVVDGSGNCPADADGGTPIPTLKRVELIGGAFTTIAIAEGIENMQIDYGLDSDGGDGQPDGTDRAGLTDGGAPFTIANWADVVSLKIHLLARATERTPGHTDDKSYVLGVAETVGASSDGYRRHAFVQSVRLVNPSARRSS